MAEADHIEKKVKGFSIRLIVVAGLFLCTLSLFAFIADEMVLENDNTLDRMIFQKLAAFTSPSLTSLMTGVTFFGSTYFLLPAYCVLTIYLLMKKNTRLVLDVAAIGLTGFIILKILKAVFRRQRPESPLTDNFTGYSFPSGHSFSSFIFFGLLIYILWNYRMNHILRWILSILFFLFA